MPLLACLRTPGCILVGEHGACEIVPQGMTREQHDALRVRTLLAGLSGGQATRGAALTERHLSTAAWEIVRYVRKEPTWVRPDEIEAYHVRAYGDREEVRERARTIKARVDKADKAGRGMMVKDGPVYSAEIEAAFRAWMGDVLGRGKSNGGEEGEREEEQDDARRAGDPAEDEAVEPLDREDEESSAAVDAGIGLRAHPGGDPRPVLPLRTFTIEVPVGGKIAVDVVEREDEEEDGKRRVHFFSYEIEPQRVEVRTFSTRDPLLRDPPMAFDSRAAWWAHFQARCAELRATPPEVLRHVCHARGCAALVSPRLLMCARHWAMVPRDIQRAVMRKDPTREYLEEAIEAVAAQEDRAA